MRKKYFSPEVELVERSNDVLSGASNESLVDYDDILDGGSWFL